MPEIEFHVWSEMLMQYLDFTLGASSCLPGREILKWALMFTIMNLKSINFIYSFVRIMVTLIIISILDLKIWNYEVSVSIIYLDILLCFLKHSCSPRFHFSLCLLNLTCNNIVVFRDIMFSFHAFLKHVHVLEVKCVVSENISSLYPHTLGFSVPKGSGISMIFILGPP